MSTEDAGIKIAQCDKLLAELETLGISAYQLFVYAVAKDTISEANAPLEDEEERMTPQGLAEANMLGELDDPRDSIIDFWTDVGSDIEALTGEKEV